MWWKKDNNKCDKCGEASLKTPANYIYSPNKTPYYSVCDKCYQLFCQYVCAVPKGYEANAYRTSVQYMFKEEKDDKMKTLSDPQEEINYIISKLDSILELLNSNIETNDRIKKAIIAIEILKSSVETGWRY